VKWVVRFQLILLIVMFLSVMDFLVGSFVHTEPGKKNTQYFRNDLNILYVVYSRLEMWYIYRISAVLRDETDLIASISASLLVIAKTVFTQIDNFQYQNQLVDTDKLFLHVEVQSNLVAKLEKYNVLYRVLKICRWPAISLSSLASVIA
jgi:hypothetical protein